MGVLESCRRGERGVGWVVRVQGLGGGSECGAGTRTRVMDRSAGQGLRPRGTGPGSRDQGLRVQDRDPEARFQDQDRGFALWGRDCGLGVGSGIGGRAPGCMAVIMSRGAGLGSGVEVQG